MPDECGRFGGCGIDFGNGGLRAHRRVGKSRCSAAQHLLHSRQRRAENLLALAVPGIATPPAQGCTPDYRCDRLHGRTCAANAAERLRRGRGGRSGCLPAAARAVRRGRDGPQGHERGAEHHRNLPQRGAASHRCQPSERLREHHARVQQLLLLLHRALHPRPRAFASRRQHPARGG